MCVALPTHVDVWSMAILLGQSCFYALVRDLFLTKMQLSIGCNMNVHIIYVYVFLFAVSFQNGHSVHFVLTIKTS